MAWEQRDMLAAELTCLYRGLSWPAPSVVMLSSTGSILLSENSLYLGYLPLLPASRHLCLFAFPAFFLTLSFLLS